MRALWKKTAILLLGFSNLAVLGTVFYTYFDNEMQPLQLFSSSDNLGDLKTKIEKECQKGIKALKKGHSYTCRINLKRRQRGAAYTLKTFVDVIKTEDDKFQITSKGRMTQKRRHATEADFCNNCEAEKAEITNDNLETIMNKVVVMAEAVYDQAAEAVTEAEKKYNEKDRRKRLAEVKEWRCQGKWDKDAEEIVEFDTAEKLECKMKKMSDMDLPLEVEEYYHKKFKREAWEVVLSGEEDYLLEDLFENFNDEPYRYPFSVRASVGLMKNYMDYWKDDYSVLDTLSEKRQFLGGIQREVQQMTSFMTQEQAQKDLFFLNRGFDGALANIQALPTRPNNTAPITTTPGSTGINYDDVRKQVQPLYGR